MGGGAGREREAAEMTETLHEKTDLSTPRTPTDLTDSLAVNGSL